MSENKYTIRFAAVLAAAVIVNALLVFFVSSLRDYVDAGGMILSRKQLSEADKILSSYEYSEYETALGSLWMELEDVREYQFVLQITDNGTKQPVGFNKSIYSSEEIDNILSGYSYSDNEAALRIAMLSYCIERLQAALAYPDYALQVVSNAALMSDVSIFDDTLVRRILKTGKDFYGHENIRVSAVPDVGVRGLFSDSLTDIIAVLLALSCALFYDRRCHAGCDGAAVIRARTGSFALAFLAGILLLYGVGAAAFDAVFSLGDMGRAIQSVSDYYTTPYMISVGTLLGIRTAFKAVACLTLYLFFVGILFCRRRKLAVSLVLTALLTELLLDLSGRGVSMYKAFHAERALMEYGSFHVLGNTVNAGWVLAVFLICLLGGAMLFAGRNVSAELLREKERLEQVYFDEINNRYTEARLIRHDINNHLAAIAMLMDEGDIDGAREYLGKVSAQLDEARPPVRTGSSVLDAVLFGKMRAAQEKGIDIELAFLTDFAGCGISDYDLCSVFGNLLDNAVEACEKLSGEDRRISLSVKRQEDMFCVYCENKYAEIHEENGGLVTLKTDRKAHGLGLKRIGRIAEKYNGTMDIRTEGGVFSISVLFVP